MARLATPEERKTVIRRGITYSRSLTYTPRVNKVAVPIDAADYTARMVIRKRLDSVEDVLTLTPGNGLTLSTTPEQSLQIIIRIGADETAELEVGRNYDYTLAITLLADPTQVTELISDKAEIIGTAL